MGIAKSNMWVGTTSSTITDSAVMIAVECLHLLLRVDHMCPDNMMIDARTVVSVGYQSTQESQVLMQDQFSFKVWLTKTELIEKVLAEIVRLEAEYMSQVPSVLAEPSGPR